MSIINCQASPEQLTKYVLYCEWLIYATWRVLDNFSSLLQSIGANEKVFHLMELLPSDQFSSEGVKLQRLVGNLRFSKVSFFYPSRMEIYIDGFPLKELDIKWLRERVGYVGQEPHLFNLDIKSNIMYGCPKDVTEEDVELAAKQAYAHEFISSLPDGYNTMVDNDLLSGGQKQRIATARAILRDPTILILDEPTSALDPESEHSVKSILHSFRNDNATERTIIVIAHRLSTIRATDTIIVMNRGRIAEMGSHEHLLKKGGLYARLTTFQQQQHLA